MPDEDAQALRGLRSTEDLYACSAAACRRPRRCAVRRHWRRAAGSESRPAARRCGGRRSGRRAAGSRSRPAAWGTGGVSNNPGRKTCSSIYVRTSMSTDRLTDRRARSSSNNLLLRLVRKPVRPKELGEAQGSLCCDPPLKLNKPNPSGNGNTSSTKSAANSLGVRGVFATGRNVNSWGGEPQQIALGAFIIARVYNSAGSELALSEGRWMRCLFGTSSEYPPLALGGV